MWLGSFHVTRRRALTTLLFLLLVAPIPLTQISARLESPGQPADSDWVFWLIIGTVLMGSAVRGARSALGLWAGLSAVIGIAQLVVSFTAVNGSVHLLAGLLAISISTVVLLIRDEIGTGSSAIVEDNVDACSP
jgi:hypothetical protein